MADDKTRKGRSNNLRDALSRNRRRAAISSSLSMKRELENQNTDNSSGQEKNKVLSPQANNEEKNVNQQNNTSYVNNSSNSNSSSSSSNTNQPEISPQSSNVSALVGLVPSSKKETETSNTLPSSSKYANRKIELDVFAKPVVLRDLFRGQKDEAIFEIFTNYYYQKAAGLPAGSIGRNDGFTREQVEFLELRTSQIAMEQGFGFPPENENFRKYKTEQLGEDFIRIVDKYQEEILLYGFKGASERFFAQLKLKNEQGIENIDKSERSESPEQSDKDNNVLEEKVPSEDEEPENRDSEDIPLDSGSEKTNDLEEITGQDQAYEDYLRERAAQKDDFVKANLNAPPLQIEEIIIEENEIKEDTTKNHLKELKAETLAGMVVLTDDEMLVKINAQIFEMEKNVKGRTGDAEFNQKYDELLRQQYDIRGKIAARKLAIKNGFLSPETALESAAIPFTPNTPAEIDFQDGMTSQEPSSEVPYSSQDYDNNLNQDYRNNIDSGGDNSDFEADTNNSFKGSNLNAGTSRNSTNNSEDKISSLGGSLKNKVNAGSINNNTDNSRADNDYNVNNDDREERESGSQDNTKRGKSTKDKVKDRAKKEVNKRLRNKLNPSKKAAGQTAKKTGKEVGKKIGQRVADGARKGARAVAEGAKKAAQAAAQAAKAALQAVMNLGRAAGQAIAPLLVNPYFWLIVAIIIIIIFLLIIIVILLRAFLADINSGTENALIDDYMNKSCLISDISVTPNKIENAGPNDITYSLKLSKSPECISVKINSVSATQEYSCKDESRCPSSNNNTAEFLSALGLEGSDFSSINLEGAGQSFSWSGKILSGDDSTVTSYSDFLMTQKLEFQIDEEKDGMVAEYSGETQKCIKGEISDLFDMGWFDMARFLVFLGKLMANPTEVFMKGTWPQCSANLSGGQMGSSNGSIDFAVGNWTASLPNTIIGGAESPMTLYPTYYYLAFESDHAGSNCAPSMASGTCTWMNNQGCSKDFISAVRMEGTGVTINGYQVRYNGSCKPFSSITSNAYGSGSRGAVIPFRTIAIDSKVIPYGSVVYLPALDGAPLPDGSKHDGCFLATDTGGAIKSNRIDIFTYKPEYASAISSQIGTSGKSGTGAIVNSKRCLNINYALPIGVKADSLL